MKKYLKKIAFSFLLVCLGARIFADDFENPPFKLNLLNDAVIFGVSGGLAGSAFLYGDVFKAKPNDYVENGYDKADVIVFDQIFMNRYNKTLHIIGTGAMILSMASPLALLCVPNSQWVTIGVMFAETLLLSQGIKEWIKNAVFRPRPYMYYDGFPRDKVESGDWNCSFPSGHTTMAFAGATFLSYVFTRYYSDSAWKYAVYGMSFGTAVLTGILRMCSGNHFFTDVLVGAIIGTGCGFLIPFLHSEAFYSIFKKKNVQTSVSPLGFNMKISF